MYAASARFWADAFEAGSEGQDDPTTGDRLRAASMAALAGAGKGEDAGTLDDAARAKWRAQAVAWLRADLAAWGEKDASAATTIVRALEHWKADSDLAGIRDEAEVAKLAPEEQEACRALWKDVDALLEGAREAGR
jgi:hypothetical protein